MKIEVNFILSLSVSFWVLIANSTNSFSDIDNEKFVSKNDKRYNHFSKGSFYAKNGLNTEAIKELNKALQETIKSDTLSVRIKNQIGNVYFIMKSFATAEEYFRKTLQESKDLKYKKGEANSLANIGSVYEKKSNYLKALEYQEKSLKVFLLTKDNHGVASVKLNIGSIYEDLNQFDKAYEYFFEAYQLLENENSYQEVDVLNNLGDVFRKRGKVLEAIEFYNKGLVLAIKLDNSELLESAYKDLSKSFSEIENFEKAYAYRVKSEEYKEITLTKQKSNQLNILQTIYESDRKEAEIKLLKETNKVSESNQKLLLVTLLSSVLLLSIFLFFYLKRQKSKQKLHEYKQRVLQAELDNKRMMEKSLKDDIQLKTASLSKYSLQLSEKNKMLSDVSSNLKKITKREHLDFKRNLQTLAKEIDFRLKQEDEWLDFNNLFSEIHPNFSKKIIEIATNKLSSSEIKLAMLLRLNISSKEIATILRVTPDSVRVARHRLRKKLPVQSKEDLVNFMLSV